MKMYVKLEDSAKHLDITTWKCWAVLLTHIVKLLISSQKARFL